MQLKGRDREMDVPEKLMASSESPKEKGEAA